MKPKAQNWNDKPDDNFEAHQNLKNALDDALICAKRYVNSLNHTKCENEGQTKVVARRIGYAELAEAIICQLYVEIK